MPCRIGSNRTHQTTQCWGLFLRPEASSSVPDPDDPRNETLIPPGAAGSADGTEAPTDAVGRIGNPSSRKAAASAAAAEAPTDPLDPSTPAREANQSATWVQPSSGPPNEPGASAPEVTLVDPAIPSGAAGSLTWIDPSCAADRADDCQVAPDQRSETLASPSADEGPSEPHPGVSDDPTWAVPTSDSPEESATQLTEVSGQRGSENPLDPTLVQAPSCFSSGGIARSEAGNSVTHPEAPSESANGTEQTAHPWAPEGVAHAPVHETLMPTEPASAESADLPPTFRPGGAAAGAAWAKTRPAEQAPEDPEPTVKTTPPRAPRARLPLVPGYQILSVLGKGGMGVVYKARDVKLDRVVALKMILAGDHAGREALVRFRTEARAVALLRHPNIVQVYETGESDGKPYVALEFLDGGTLQQQLDGVPQKPQQAARLLETLARAMHYAHQRGIIHRDLKPANILLDADGTPKITDFGLAKRLEQEDQGQTGTEAILGTPTYMAPEQAAGKTRDVGPAADIYALGAILYDVLTGRPPLRGTTIHDTLHLVLNNDPVPPRRLQPTVPLDLQTICLKCLLKEPARRYANAEALADDLARFLADQPIEARPTTTLERLVKWARRRPAEALLVLVSALLVIGLVIGLVVFAAQARSQSDKDRQRAEEAVEEQRRLAASEKLAREQEQLAREQRDRANEQEQLVKEQKNRANYNLKQAQDAVKRLTSVAHSDLPNEPRLVRLRERLLNEALEFSEGILKRQSDDPDSRLQAARANLLVGDIREALGEHGQAQEAYRAAAALYEGLLGPPPGDPVVRSELAGTFLNLWVVQAGLGQRTQAAETLRRAKDLLTALVRQFPDEAQYQRDLALCFNNEGIQASTDVPANLAQAESAFREALRRFAALPPAEQDKPSCLLEQARTEKNLAALLLKRDQAAAAALQAEAALKKLERLLAADPDRVAFRKEYGQVSANLAVLLVALNDLPKAEKVCDDVVARFRDLAQKFGEVVDNRHLLALALANRADVRRRREQWDGARTDLLEARTLLTRLVADLPDQPVYAVDLARTLNRLGLVSLLSDRAEEAIAAWERALAVCEPFVKDPQRADARRERERAAWYLLRWYDARCRVLLGRQPVADALEPLQRLVKLRQQLLASCKAFPDECSAPLAAVAVLGPAVALTSFEQDMLRTDLAGTRLALAGLHVGLGNPQAAHEVLGELADAPPWWPKLPDAALLAARCLNLIRDDTRLTATERRQQTEACRAQVLTLLRRADEHNLVPAPGLLDDAAFAPLAADPEFRTLRASFEQRRINPR